MPEGAKICTKCKSSLPLSLFNKSRKNVDGHRSECKGCQAKEGKESRERILPPPTKVTNLKMIFDGVEYVEEWGHIHWFKEREYQVSTFGRVKGMPSRYNRDEKLLTPRKQARDNYFYVKLCSDKKEYAKNIHRLVAKAFHANPENKPQVNHEDGDKLNNFYKNLAWATAKENKDHAIKMGLDKSPKGEAHYLSKLTKSDVLDIVGSTKKIVELAKIYNVDSSTVDQIKRGKSWRSVTNLSRSKKYDDSFINMVTEIAYSEKSIKELSSLYGLSYWVVRNIKSGKSHNRFTKLKEAA
jgi:hypothetical protein